MNAVYKHEKGRGSTHLFDELVLGLLGFQPLPRVDRRGQVALYLLELGRRCLQAILQCYKRCAHRLRCGRGRARRSRGSERRRRSGPNTGQRRLSSLRRRRPPTPQRPNPAPLLLPLSPLDHGPVADDPLRLVRV